MFLKKANRYASQPQMPQGQPPQTGMTPMGGQINVGRMTGMGMNSNIAQAANAGAANPNPLTQVTPGKHGLATAGGIQQAAQTAGMNPAPPTQNPPGMTPMMPKMGGVNPDNPFLRARDNWLESLIPVFKAQVKAAEVATGGSMSPTSSPNSLGSGGQNASTGMGNPGMGTPAGRPGAQNQQGQMGGGGGAGGGTGLLGGNSGPGGQVGAFGVVRPGWNSLRPSTPALGGVTRPGAGLTKAGMMPAGGPTPGLTANQPVPQPGMAPPPPGMPPMPPPNGGAPIPGAPGQPSIDPASGQPLPPTVNGQPAPPPGQDPAAAGGAPPPGMPQQPPAPMDPMTGQPVSSPMQDPPPPTLPGNPRMLPPRPATGHDHAQMGTMNSLMGDKTRADVPTNAGEATEDIQAEAAAMGSKTAGDWRYALMAELALATPKSAFEKSAGLAKLLGGVFKGAAKASPTARTVSANAPTQVYRPGQAASAVVTPSPGGEGHAAAMHTIERQFPMLHNWLKTGKRVGFSVAPVAAAGAGKELAAADKSAMAAWRSPQALAAITSRLGVQLPAGGNRLTALSRAKGGMGLGTVLPGVEKKVGELPVARLPDSTRLTGVPDRLFRGHAELNPMAGHKNFAGAVHASPMAPIARTYGAAGPGGSVPGVGQAGLVSEFAPAADQRYWAMGKMRQGVRGGHTAEQLLETARGLRPSSPLARLGGVLRRPQPELRAATVTNRGQTEFGVGAGETNVAGMTPTARYLSVTGGGVNNSSGPVRHFPPTPANDAFYAQLRQPAAPVKTAAQDDTSLRSPERSAVGESKGLRINMQSDHDLFGPKAWESITTYQRSKAKTKSRPDLGKHAAYDFDAEDCPKCGASMEGDSYTGTCNSCQHKWGTPKYASLTPFARGFFEHCDVLGVDPAAAVEKVGSDYGDEARQELRDGLEKLAWGPLARGAGWAMQQGERFLPGAGNFARGLFGGAKPIPLPQAARTAANPGAAWSGVAQNAGRAAPLAASPAMRAGNAVNRTVGAGWNAVPGGMRGQLGYSAGGGALGALSGKDTPFDTGSTWGNAAVGAAAFNPYLNRMVGGTRGMGALANPVTRGVQGGLLGAGGGYGLDVAAGMSGLKDAHGNPTTNFSRMGGFLGSAFGTASGAGRAMRQLAPAGSSVQQAGQRLMAFGEGGLAPIRAPFTAAGRLAGLSPAGAAPVGRFANAARMGRNAGILGTGIMGTQQLINGGMGVADDYLASRMPQVRDNMAQFADEYIGSRLPALQDSVNEHLSNLGLLGADGRFNPLAGVGQRLGGGVDAIFRGLGMDPSRMSPLQKMMVLGGAGVGGIGAAAGSPVMAGMGGVGAMAGLLPQFMPGQGQQRLNQQYMPGQQPPGGQPGQPQGPNTPPPNTPQARNEWLLQQQQQGG